MAIIIKNIDMPENCESCVAYRSMYNFEKSCWDYKCDIDKGIIHNKSHIRDNCPIKPVNEMLSGLCQLKQVDAVGSIEHMSAIAFNAGISRAIEYIKEYCEVEE